MRVLFGVMMLGLVGDCEHILAIIPVSVKSHYLGIESLLRELAARGHQVTVYSSFPQKVSLPNFTDIDCSEGRKIWDLKEILDSSSEGVILLSFGTQLRVSSLPSDKLDIMMKVFSKIPQKVLMKYEDEPPNNAPNNIIFRKWLPQRDILEHKNVVAFISHGGLASIMEAVHCAKPLIGVPLFADQYLNMNNVVWKDAGALVDIGTMTEQNFKHSIDQVVNSPKIAEGMKMLSQQFRDRPMSALQSAVYWTEYVMKHRGAPHLRPVATSLLLYQLYLIDVCIFSLVVVGLILYVLHFIAKYFFSLIAKNFSPLPLKSNFAKKNN